MTPKINIDRLIQKLADDTAVKTIGLEMLEGIKPEDKAKISKEMCGCGEEACRDDVIERNASMMKSYVVFNTRLIKHMKDNRGYLNSAISGLYD